MGGEVFLVEAGWRGGRTTRKGVRGGTWKRRLERKGGRGGMEFGRGGRRIKRRKGMTKRKGVK